MTHISAIERRDNEEIQFALKNYNLHCIKCSKALTFVVNLNLY